MSLYEFQIEPIGCGMMLSVRDYPKLSIPKVLTITEAL